VKLSEQKAVVRRLRTLSIEQSRAIREHRDALGIWKRERLASPGSLALFFAAGLLWGRGKKDTDAAAGESSVKNKVARTANTAFLVSRLFTSPVVPGGMP
jgi:hypothetical protein